MAYTIIDYFDSKVRELQQQFAAVPILLSAGQFQVMATAKNEMGRQVDAEGAAAGISGSDPLTRAIIAFFKAPIGEGTHKQAEELRAQIEASPFKERFPNTLR